MPYIPLYKIYYKHPEAYEKEYLNRFSATSTTHFPIEIKQYGRNHSYPAFFCYTEEIVMLLQKIYQKYIELSFLNATIPHILLRQFILSCITDEIQSTNDIEGIRSTKREIRNIIDNIPDADKPSRLRSIVDKYLNILEGKSFIFNSCNNIREFYDEFALEEVTSENPNHAPDGKIFRSGPVDITNNAQKTIHQGICPESTLIEYMNIALSKLNDDSIPSLVRIAIFHYLFNYIHPFYDGNGRTSRFIASYYLTQEFDETIALRLSVIIKKNKSKYYSLFSNTDSELNRGDLTNFVIGFLEFVLLACEDTYAILHKKNLQRNKYAQILDKMKIGDSKTQNICRHLLDAALFFGQGITIQQIMEYTELSRVTVQKRLDELPKEYLIISKVAKPYRYKLNMLLFK